MSQYIVKSAVSDKSQAVFFPTREKELQSCCDNLGIANDMKSKVVVLEIIPDRRLTGLLTEREYNISELNLFATVYDALNKYEKDIFFAVVEAKKYDTLFNFINLCCNTDCYGLVDDFSDLDAIGKKIYLNEVGMKPEQELARFNGEAFIMGIMEHNPPLITSQGIIYQNNNFEKKVYNGKCFPSLDTNKPITLCLNTKLDRDFLYLPCERSEVNKALERLNANSLSDVGLEVDDYDLPKNIADIVLADLTDFEKLNSIAKTLDEVGKHVHGHLSQLAEFTKITATEELEVLSSCMFEFEVLPNIYHDYQYGYHMIAESGRFDYDENLEEYIDFERYGRERNSMNDSMYTEKGYIHYLGYNQDMCNILNKNLGMNLDVEPNTQTLRLYMPLEFTTYYEEDEYGRFRQTEYEGTLSSYELDDYEDELNDFIKDQQPEIGSERELMDYYDHPGSINAKVKSYHLEIERVDSTLYGVAVCELNAPLGQEELDELKGLIIGQVADGVGEGIEQREFNLGQRDIYVHLWQGDNWYIRTAEEMGFDEPEKGFEMEMQL